AVVLHRQVVDVVGGAVLGRLDRPFDLDPAIRVGEHEDGRVRRLCKVAPFRAHGRRVEEHVLAVGVDPHHRRLRAPALVDGRDDCEVRATEQLDLRVAEARHQCTTVGMFLILPDSISAFTRATLPAMPAGAFGENLPMPTPFCLMPYTASVPPLNRPSFAFLIDWKTAVSTRFSAEVSTHGPR